MTKHVGRINEEYKEKKIKVDEKDKKILMLLSRGARMPATQIAKKIHLSRDAVSYRINRLVEKGVILRFFPEIKFLKLGYYTFNLLLQLDENDYDKNEKLIHELKNHPNIVGITEYSDKWDLGIILIAKSVLEFDNLLSEFEAKYSDIILERNQLQLLKTYTINHVPWDVHYTQDYKVMTSPEPVKMDKIDSEILRILSENCRVSNYEVGQKVGLSSDAIAYRIKNLVKERVIKKFSIMLNYSLLDYDWYTFAIRMKMFDKQSESKFKAFVNNHSRIRRAMKTLGNWDLILYIATTTPKETHLIVKDIKKTFSKTILNYQTWMAYKEHMFEPFPKIIYSQ